MADGMQLVTDAGAPNAHGLRSEILSGLTAPRKQAPSKYFYDAEGSRLFEAICELPEYYLTRAEFRLLARIAPLIAGRLPLNTALIEFGSGASAKTRLILDAAPQITHYFPIDISASALSDAARAIAERYIGLVVHPLHSDFTQGLRSLPTFHDGPQIGFFPGSTIGNFTPDQAHTFLEDAREALGDQALLLIGADLAKSPEVLVAAYDDALGVTAAFNKNLLVRLNRELAANFDLAAFVHRAIWNAQDSRIEMHLVSTRRQAIQISGVSIDFEAGETIHTENSHKYQPGAMATLAKRAGWSLEQSWTSESPEFGIFLLSAA